MNAPPLFHHATHLAIGVFFTDDAPQVGDRRRELPVPVLGGDEALGVRCVLRRQYRVDGGRVQLGEHGRGCARLVPEPHERKRGTTRYHDTGLSLMWRRVGACVCVRADVNGKRYGSGSGESYAAVGSSPRLDESNRSEGAYAPWSLRCGLRQGRVPDDDRRVRRCEREGDFLQWGERRPRLLELTERALEEHVWVRGTNSEQVMWW